MNVGSIAGGTHAGWRKVKQAHPKWECMCSTEDGMKGHPGWRNSCDDCGDTRPT